MKIWNIFRLLRKLYWHLRKLFFFQKGIFKKTLPTLLFIVTSRNSVIQLFEFFINSDYKNNYNFVIFVDGDPVERVFQKNKVYYKTFLDYFTTNIKKVILKENPSLIILPEDRVGLGNEAISTGRDLGIKSLAIQNGALLSKYPKNVFLTMNISEKRLFTVFANKIALAGANSYKILSKFNSKKRLFITGQPEYDGLLGKRFGDKLEILSSLNFPKNKKIILFAPQPIPENIVHFKSIISALSGEKDFFLIVKLHPGEKSSGEEYYSALSDKDVNIKIGKTYDLWDLLNICDLLITSYSTVAEQAMILKKPIITLNFTDESDWLDYSKEGASVGVHKSEELKEAISKCIYDKKFIDNLLEKQVLFLRNQCGILDGNSSKRVFELIDSMHKE